ncbi:MAG: GNAT family N-acetyltransferase [Renibacterium sp.]|nr:GNAT family N-acetyltransferase [Renibacterium sp.]
METFATERLLLRRWTPADADFVFDLYSRWEVKQFIGAVPSIMESRQEAVDRIEKLRAFDHPVHGFWAVQNKQDGELLGTILFKLIPASGEVPPVPSAETEIGWHFHPDAWGRGYASEAATRVLAHGFEQGLERIVAVTSPDNRASQKVCLRIGMQHRGRTTDFYNTECELFVAEQAS